MSRKIGQAGLCLVLGACLLAGCGNPAEGLSFGGSVNGNSGFAAVGDKLAYAKNLENGSVLERLDREKGAALQTEYGLYFPYYACGDAVLGRTADDAIGLFRLEDYKLSTVLRLPADRLLLEIRAQSRTASAMDEIIEAAEDAAEPDRQEPEGKEIRK